MKCDDDQAAPCPLGMLAATVALMTRYADAAPGRSVAGPCNVHPLLAKKIASNLLFLQHHPALPPQFGQVMAQVRLRWCDLINRGSDPTTHLMETTCAPLHH